MNRLMIAYPQGRLDDLHPSDPVWFVLVCYEAAIETMLHDVPEMSEIMLAMLDLYVPTFAGDGDIASWEDGALALNTCELEDILMRNGFDFIDCSGIRTNCAQTFIGGELCG